MVANETLGANLFLAVTVVAGALDDERREMLSHIKPDDWVPTQLLSDFITSVEQRDPEKVTTMARAVMYAGKGTFLKDLEPLTPTKVFEFMAQSFERNNRGPDIGYWKVLRSEPGFAELETTDYTGENFVEGLVVGAVRVAQGTDVRVEKRLARSRGDAVDVFSVTWEEP